MNTDPHAIELPRPRTGLDAVYDGKIRELLKTYNHLESPSVFIKRLVAVYQEAYGVEGKMTRELQEEAIAHLSFENLEQLYIKVGNDEEKESD